MGSKFYPSQCSWRFPAIYSRYIFYALVHGCKFIFYVSSIRHVRSPITKGGLKIESSVTVKWDIEDKFQNLKQFIEDNYSFARSLEDHSMSILKEILEGLELGDTENAVEDNVEDEPIDENDNILMITDEDLQEEIELNQCIELIYVSFILILNPF